MLHTLVDIDTHLMLWLNGFHNSFFDTFWYIITSKYTWMPMYCFILYVLYRKIGLKWQLLGLIAMFALTITVSDQLCGHVIRGAVERMRPSNPDNPISSFIHIVNGYRGGKYGFPSCHASNSFALATLLWLFFRHRKLTVFIFCWAILNSYSRIYVGVHYPGDLLVGSIVGGLGAAAVYYIARWLLRFKTHEEYRHIDSIMYAGLITIGCTFIYTAVVALIGV